MKILSITSPPSSRCSEPGLHLDKHLGRKREKAWCGAEGTQASRESHKGKGDVENDSGKPQTAHSATLEAPSSDP